MYKIRTEEWREQDEEKLRHTIRDVVEKGLDKNKHPSKYHSAVKELKDLVDKTPELDELFSKMFEEVEKEYQDELVVKSFDEALVALDYILTEPPPFDEVVVIGCPVSVLFYLVMETKSGHKAFNDKKVNEIFRKILNEWSKFLTTPESVKYVSEESPHGWLCPDALKLMKNFKETFQCDPSDKPHWGFTSWDNFFTRKLQPNARPVDEPDDDSFVSNPCESSPYNLIHNAEEHAPFWAKGQPYSLRDIFKENPLHEHYHEQFIGGTIYQAYLSALNYHRWHSPVNGKIVKSWIIEGKYFEEPPYFQEGPKGMKQRYTSQAYLAETATRAIILIEADNTSIGLMAFVAIGMFEVSTCEITVSDGQRVRKGDELGLFHFGGSTSLMIFQPSTKIYFGYFGDNIPHWKSDPIHINQKIARVREVEEGEYVHVSHAERRAKNNHAHACEQQQTEKEKQNNKNSNKNNNKKKKKGEENDEELEKGEEDNAECDEENNDNKEGN